MAFALEPLTDRLHVAGYVAADASATVGAAPVNVHVCVCCSLYWSGPVVVNVHRAHPHHFADVPIRFPGSAGFVVVPAGNGVGVPVFVRPRSEPVRPLVPGIGVADVGAVPGTVSPETGLRGAA